MEIQTQGLAICCVPDGNRRYEMQEGLERYQGHRKGYDALKCILRDVWDHDVDNFIFWALSKDNGKNREPEEVGNLFRLLDQGIEELREDAEFKKRDIRFRVVGDYWNRNLVPARLALKVDTLQEETKSRCGQTFTLLLAYNGDEEFLGAIDRMRGIPRSIPTTANLIDQCMPSGFLGCVDMYVRTGGEMHLSNGELMWQLRKAHFFSTETLWPDFTMNELASMIKEFKSRERRSGA